MRSSVTGLTEVVRDLQREAVTSRVKAEVIVVRHAAKVAQRMRDRVAVASGTTRDSITSDDEAWTTSTGVVGAAAGPTHFVAGFLERGTARMAPKPFVGPAFDETVPEFVDDMRGVCGF